MLQAARRDCAAVVSAFESNFGTDGRGVYEPLALFSDGCDASQDDWRSNASVYSRRRHDAGGKLVHFLLSSRRLQRIIVCLLGGKSVPSVCCWRADRIDRRYCELLQPHFITFRHPLNIFVSQFLHLILYLLHTVPQRTQFFSTSSMLSRNQSLQLHLHGIEIVTA